MFQSTRPARGATYLTGNAWYLVAFQSTRPARGATHEVNLHPEPTVFQSTRPARGATCASVLSNVHI